MSAKRVLVGAPAVTSIAADWVRAGRWRKQSALSEAFRAQTFPHVDAVYTDALCLTGSQEDAADLVVEVYTRAFMEYETSGRECLPNHLGARGTLAWLYHNLHAAFCEAVLTCASRTKTHMGETP